jgi:hypothetical protein
MAEAPAESCSPDKTSSASRMVFNIDAINIASNSLAAPPASFMLSGSTVGPTLIGECSVTAFIK